MSTFNIERYLQQGEQRRWSKADEDYGDNTGVLRGGNSGCVDKSGNVSGHCHRLSLLDFLGVRTFTPDAPKRRMFDAGHWNEDQWAANLDASDLLQDGYLYLREEEARRHWTVTNPVTGEEVLASGRPDLLVIKPHENYVPPMRLSSGDVTPAQNYTPIHGFELKKISSAWRTNQVYWVDDASNDYLIQAANYSLRFNKIPWTVCFSNYDSHNMYYAYVKQGSPEKIQPGRKHFQLTWEGDQLFVDSAPSTVTGAGIDAYYELLLEMKETENLGPRPSFKSVLPGKKDQFNACKNCDLSSLCDKYDADRDYEEFVATARHLTEGEK